MFLYLIKIHLVLFFLSAGFTLPFGVSAAFAAGTATFVGTMAVGVGGAYITTSYANRNLNPGKWDWKSPVTFNGLFEGFSAGVGIFGGVNSIYTASPSALNSVLRYTVVPTAVGVGVGYAYYQGVRTNNGSFAFWKWDYDEETMADHLGAMFAGFGTVVSVGSLIQNRQALAKSAKKVMNKVQKLKHVLRQSPKVVVKAVTGTALGVVAVSGADKFSEIDFENFKFNKLSTYENFIGGFLSGWNLVSDASELQDVFTSRSNLKMKKAVRSSRPKKNQSGLKRSNAIRKFTSKPAPQGLKRQNAKRFTRSLPFNGSLVKLVPKFVVMDVFGSKDSSKIQTLSNKEEPDKPLVIMTPNTFIVEAGTFNIPNMNQNGSSFNILEMGDKWLQQTSFASNLTMLNLLVEKFLGSKKATKQSEQKHLHDNVEISIAVSEITHEFVEYFLQEVEAFSVPDNVINDMLESSIDIQTLMTEVRKEINRKSFDKIPKLLLKLAIDENLEILNQHLNKNEIVDLKMKLHEKCEEYVAKSIDFENRKKQLLTLN